MANYRSKVQVTLQNRRAAYDAIAMFVRHLDPLNVNLLSMIYNTTTNYIDIVTGGSIPVGQLDHLGIVEV